MHWPVSDIHRFIQGSKGQLLAPALLCGQHLAAAMPDIKERLERYEWDRMNLADLTGCY